MLIGICNWDLAFFPLLNTYNKRETGGVGAEGKPHAGEDSARVLTTAEPRQQQGGDGAAEPPATLIMPPRKMAKAATSKGPPPQCPVELLISRCGRASLESLVLASFRNNTPVSLTDLEAANPDLFTPPVLAQVSAASPVLEDSGLLSLLPVDVLSRIVKNMPLPTRLTLSTEICRGLRPLRHISELWEKLGTSMFADGRFHGYEDIHWTNSRGLLRLADWLPDCGVVKDLSLHARGAAGAFLPSELIEFVARFPKLQRLALTGAAVVKKVLVGLAATDYPQLRHLMLDWGTVGPQTVLNLLERMPKLDTLEAAQFNGGVLEGLSKIMRNRRQGGVPTLLRLRQTYDYADKLTLLEGCSVGKWFPELTDLTTSFGVAGPTPTQPLDGGNLRRLHVYKMMCSFHAGNPHLSSGSLSAMARLFISKCPRLESISLTHGTKYLSRNEVLPPLPRLASAFINVRLPKTLVMLHLQDIVVHPEDFADSQLPELVLLRLVHCGPRSHEVAEFLVGTCPKLEPAGCLVSLSNRPLLPEEDVPSARRVRAKWQRFPRADLANSSLDRVIDVLEQGYCVGGP